MFVIRAHGPTASVVGLKLQDVEGRIIRNNRFYPGGNPHLRGVSRRGTWLASVEISCSRRAFLRSSL